MTDERFNALMKELIKSAVPGSVFVQLRDHPANDSSSTLVADFILLTRELVEANPHVGERILEEFVRKWRDAK